jgi:hypothetical protein
MNNRINELAVQAGGIWRGGYVEQPNGDSVWTERKFVVDVDTEQFARLLIQECASAVNSRDDSDTGFWANIIKQHFGVEL